MRPKGKEGVGGQETDEKGGVLSSLSYLSRQVRGVSGSRFLLGGVSKQTRHCNTA